MGAAEQGRAIRTVHDALVWGDEWVSAWVALQSNTEALEHQVFMLQARAVILEAELLLLRYNVAQSLGSLYECGAE